jgi:hypothetical protein
MSNIFSYAPKELTNSAMWAWILSALKTEDHHHPRYAIAQNILNRLDVPIPRPEDIAEIHTERSFKKINTGKIDIPSVKGRVDIFLRVAGAAPAVLFIENKVVENDIERLYRQIKDYDEQFQFIKRQLPAYASNIYPAYFGYEDWVADQLVLRARQSDGDFAHRLKVFPVTAMIDAFQGTEFDQDPVLKQFYSWLIIKKKFVTIRRQARMKSYPPVADVIEAARDFGFGHLLEQFMAGYAGCSLLRQQITQVRSEIRNINFFQGRGTPLTVRWFYNSGPNGLYVGLHQNIERLTGIDFFQNLPEDFGYEQDGEWIFGYLRTERHIQAFWTP